MLDIKKLLTKVLKNTPEIRTGYETIGSVPANSYTDFSITFGSAMAGTPRVIVNLVSTATTPTMGSFHACAINASTTGFTVRIFNNTSSARSPAIRYVAMYGGGA